MPNIRIKDIPTTASATSSTDFIGIDGSANGTRKLDAYSPTFGGNLTVSGGGTSRFAGPISANSQGSFGNWGFGVGALGSAAFYLPGNSNAGSPLAAQLYLGEGNFNSALFWNQTPGIGAVFNSTIGVSATLAFYRYNGAARTEEMRINGSTGNLLLGTTTDDVGKLQVNGSVTAYTGAKAVSGSSSLVLKSTDASALSGALTLYTNATGSSRYLKLEAFEQGFGGRSLVLQENGGSVLISTNVDSGNGKLQLATHTTSAGGIGFGTDWSLYRQSAADFALVRSTNNPFYFYSDSANQGIFTNATAIGSGFYVTPSTNRFTIRTANIDAVYFDATQRGIFSGDVVLNKTGTDPFLYSGGGRGLMIGTNAGALAMTIDASQRIILSGALRLNNAYTASAVVPTGYVTIQDSTGTTYKVCVLL